MDQNVIITIIAVMLFICCVVPMLVKRRSRGKEDAPKRENDITKRKE